MVLGSFFEKLAFSLLVLLDRLIDWFDRNFGLIVFTVCFLAFLYVVWRVAKLYALKGGFQA